MKEVSPETCSLEQYLEFNDRFFCSNPNGLWGWDIMSAVRGPDKVKEAEGKMFTAEIRLAAFPKTAASNSDVSHRAIFSKQMAKISSPPSEYHFWEHIAEARNALRQAGKEGPLEPLPDPVSVFTGVYFTREDRVLLGNNPLLGK